MKQKWPKASVPAVPAQQPCPSGVSRSFWPGLHLRALTTPNILNPLITPVPVPGFARAQVIEAGVYLKAVFTPLKIGSTEISRSLITQINILGCFVNFGVIFRYIWEEIVFLNRVVKLREIRNIEDLVKF